MKILTKLFLMIVCLASASIVVPGQSSSDLCLVNDADGSILAFNIQTGIYKYQAGNGFAISGTGQVTKDGCNVMLEHKRPDGQVIASVSLCDNVGKAVVEIASPQQDANISTSYTDLNLSDNPCGTPQTPQQPEEPKPAAQICVQDPIDQSLLRFDTTTGDYRYLRASDKRILSGTGQVKRDGCTVTLEDLRSDRRVVASVNFCQSEGKASIETFNNTKTKRVSDVAPIQDTISDNNLNDNNCN